MSSQAIGGAASGLSFSGLVRGMNRISANTAMTRNAIRMIGAQSCSHCQKSG